MKKIKNYFIYLLISFQKRINDFTDKYQAVYYKKLYQERLLFTTIPHFGPNFYIDLQQKSSIQFKGGSFSRGSFSIIGRNDGKIEIGNQVFFNIGCSISCFKSVIIGDNVMFGEGVKIYDHNHEYRNQDEIFAEQGYNISSVTIGNNCWIGTNVIILKGVSIGDNVVIGAGLLINKDIDSNQIIIKNQDLLYKKL